MSNTQYRDLLVQIGYSEDEAWVMVEIMQNFDEECEDQENVS